MNIDLKQEYDNAIAAAERLLEQKDNGIIQVTPFFLREVAAEISELQKLTEPCKMCGSVAQRLIENKLRVENAELKAKVESLEEEITDLGHEMSELNERID